MTNPRPADPRAGLCGRCRHSRKIISGRGSMFLMCELSATDSSFRKYPPIPVVSCVGFEEKEV